MRWTFFPLGVDFFPLFFGYIFFLFGILSKVRDNFQNLKIDYWKSETIEFGKNKRNTPAFAFLCECLYKYLLRGRAKKIKKNKIPPSGFKYFRWKLVQYNLFYCFIFTFTTIFSVFLVIILSSSPLIRKKKERKKETPRNSWEIPLLKIVFMLKEMFKRLEL